LASCAANATWWRVAAGWLWPAWPPSLVFAVFFEVVIGIGGRRSLLAGRYALPALLIVAGLALLGRSLLAARRR
jgi:hypothetical protein